MGMKRNALISTWIVMFVVSLIVYSAGQSANEFSVEIKGTRLDVFDAASQVLIGQGFSIVTVNERIGLITTDYINAKSSFGGDLLLSFLGKKDLEIMISTKIRDSKNISILTLVVKARAKSKSKYKEEYDEVQLSKKSAAGILEKIATEIKYAVEGTETSPDTSAPDKMPEAEERPSKPERSSTTTESVRAEAPPPSSKKPAITGPTSHEVRSASKILEKTSEQLFVVVITNAANIRKHTSIDSGVLLKAIRGTKYRVIGMRDQWYEINLELESDKMSRQSSGYIHKSVVKEIKETNIIEAEMSTKRPLEKEEESSGHSPVAVRKTSHDVADVIDITEVLPAAKGSVYFGGIFCANIYGGKPYSSSGETFSQILNINSFRYFVLSQLGIGVDLSYQKYLENKTQNTISGLSLGPGVSYLIKIVQSRLYANLNHGLYIASYNYGINWREYKLRGWEFRFGGGLVYFVSKNLAVLLDMSYRLQLLSGLEAEGINPGNMFMVSVGLGGYIY